MKIKSGLIIALAAGGVAGIAQAEDLSPRQINVDQYKPSNQFKYVYANGLTGERVIVERATRVDVRGAAGWTWDQSNTIDPCGVALVGGFDPDNSITWVCSACLHDPVAGAAIAPDAVGSWGGWFDHPGDTIISGLTFGTFNQILDPDEDGVVGLDMILVLTDNDRAPAAQRSGAVPTGIIIFEELNGAADLDNSGDIDFTEGNIWIYYFDFAGAGFDVEIGDTNGVYDGNFPDDGLFNPNAGVDLGPGGVPNGRINSGYHIFWRQPGVAEGDQIIDRWPELAGLGLENPDGLDPNTFPNIKPIGSPLISPSAVLAEYALPDPNTAGAGEWPRNTPGLPPEPSGSFDAFLILDALGTDIGAFWFGGFKCDVAGAPTANGPFYDPWAGTWMQFNINGIDPGPQGCNPADLVEPFGILDLADITAFVVAFTSVPQDPIADLAPPFGVFDLADISAFVTAFLAGCPQP